MYHLGLIFSVFLNSIDPKLTSLFLGPKMCTTLAKEGNKSGNAECGRVDNATGEFIEGSVWHSCEEWCLSKVRLFSRNSFNQNY